MRRFSVALLFLAVAATARADWSILSATSEPGRAGILHRHVVLENSSTGARAIVDLATFSSKSCTLQVVQNEDGTRSLAEVMTHEKCLAGVNGGYFDPDFAPIGLLIADGKMIAPLRRARLLTGVLTASPRGVRIMRSGEFSRNAKPNAAVQCGPFLVDGDKGVLGLDDSRSARRTFAATGINDRVALGFCSDTSLAELATILATTRVAGDFKIQRALNLDGGSSSAFWFARESGEFSIPEQKSVRDFVAIVPR